MANIKISELPQVTSLLSTDIIPSVAGVDTSKITIKNLADSLTQVSSSISSSHAISASWAPTIMSRIGLITTGSSGLYQKITGSLGIGSPIGTAGNGSLIVGYDSQAPTNYSLAQGFMNAAIAESSHAEGFGTQTNGVGSHTEGRYTSTFTEFAHAEGDSTKAYGTASHAEGQGSMTIGNYSHAEGHFTTASANYSHAEGRNTVANGEYQHVQGQFNISSTAPSAFIIGNGTSSAARRNLVFASGSQFQITGSTQITGSLSTIGNIQANSGEVGVVALGVTGSVVLSDGYLMVKDSSIDAGTGFFINPNSSYLSFAQPNSSDEFYIALSGSGVFYGAEPPSTLFYSTKGFKFTTNTGRNLEVSSSFKVSGSADFNRGLIVTGSVLASGSIQINGQSTVQTVKITATSARILALPTTPIQLVPAPGPGKAIIPLSFTMKNGVGTKYDGSSFPNFTINVGTPNGNYFIVSFGATNPYPLASPNTYFTYPANIDKIWYNDNQAIEFTTDGNTPINGTFDVDMYLTYQEITL